jgi:hypothetical protein
MASVEGIRSPVSTQPSARSPKLCIYESLFLWNQGVDQVVATLRSMEKLSCADKQSLQFAQVEIEEIRADVNADFAEELVDLERVDEGRFWKQKRAYEKKWRDPDDVYIDVEQREEERKKQGLPPRIGIVPYAAVADEEKRIEEEQEQMKQRPIERPKPTVNAKSAVRGGAMTKKRRG